MDRLRGTPAVGALGAALLTAGSFSIGGRAELAGPAPTFGWWSLVSGSGQIAGLVVVWCGVALLAGAWFADFGPARRGELPAAELRLRLLAWSLPLLPALPVFSVDSWSYLAQGQMLFGPFDPYVDGPGTAGGSFAAFVHPDWRYTPAPYGPLQLGLTHLIAAATAEVPWLGIIALRAATCAALALAGWALVALARELDADPGFALWLGLANPIVIVHLVCGIHNDAFALALTLPALLLALRAAQAAHDNAPRFRASWLLLGSGAVFGAAVAVKVTAVIAMPFAVWFASRRLVGACGRGCLLTAGALLSLAALSVLTTSGFGWVGALSVSDRVVTWVAVPTAAAHLLAAAGAGSFEDLVVLCRTAGRALLVLVLVATWWLGRMPAGAGAGSSRSAQLAGWRHTLGWLAVAFAALFLLNSVSWPWYWVFVLALVPLVRQRRMLEAATLAGIVGQMLTTGPNGSTTLYTPVQVILAVCAAALTFVLVARVTQDEAARRPSPARGA